MKDSCKTCHYFNAGDSMGMGTCLNDDNAKRIKTNTNANNGHKIDKLLYMPTTNKGWCCKWKAIKNAGINTPTQNIK